MDSLDKGLDYDEIRFAGDIVGYADQQAAKEGCNLRHDLLKAFEVEIATDLRKRLQPMREIVAIGFDC